MMIIFKSETKNNTTLLLVELLGVTWGPCIFRHPISKELQKYNMDIMALSGVRFTESGCIREETGYTFYWSRKTSTDKSECGVTFSVWNCLLSSMSEDAKPVSDRFITLRFPLVNSRYCTLIAVYAPTVTNCPEKISSFYNELEWRQKCNSRRL